MYEYIPNRISRKRANGDEEKGDEKGANQDVEIGSEWDTLHYKLRGSIGEKKFLFLIGLRLLIFGRILMKFFVLV